MITSLEFIIASLVISICTSAITGTLVFCILKKKYDNEVKYLKFDIEEICKAFDKLKENYLEHRRKYH